MGRSVKALEAPGGQLGGALQDPGAQGRVPGALVPLGLWRPCPGWGGAPRGPSRDLCRALGCKGPDTGKSEGGQQDNPLPLVAENS